MEEFTGKEEQIGLLVKDGDADATNKNHTLKMQKMKLSYTAMNENCHSLVI